MISRYLVSMALAVTVICGCTTQGGGPLVFVVTHTVGIDIQATSASSATPGLTVGYKSLDLAIVPTQMATDGGDALLGCYAVGQSGAETPALCGSADIAKQVTHMTGTKPGAPSQTHHEAVDFLGYDPLDPRYRTGDVSIDKTALLHKVVDSRAVPAAPPGTIPGATGVADPASDKFAESLVDAYSVYASFNTSAKAGGSAPGVGIGEVFATGDAAVQLAEAVNYFSSREGNAEIIKAQGASTCVAQLTAAKQAGVDMSKVPDCPATATPQPNPVPTLTSIAPVSGNTPAAGASAGTVVAITLTGTGFNAASGVTVLGAAGVTADKPKPAADGKTLTVNLTVAPGAATGARELFVTNPAPGGGTTTTQTFTVN